MIHSGVIPLNYSILILLSKRQLMLAKNGKYFKSYPVGVGKFNTPSPTGRFMIVSKVPNPGGPFGVMWLGLSVPHHGIHGTNNPASIGGQVSKGCIRMQNRDVIDLAGYVTVGTPVTIRS
ncbi:L,D-transpeptidase [Acetonema longum]|uniref:L,D-transpeptidase n=1 Tax=Acetonema longum TaxID=2374 RepID=UPI00067FE97D|nr:L,D-transpeptidase [Acetonema longum]